MVTSPVPSRPLLRVRGRSFMALVLAPEAPVTEWLLTLDDQMRRSPAFFDARPVVVDMSLLAGAGEDMSALIASLEQRDIRIIGVEGADPSWTDPGVWGRPPLTYTSQTDRFIEVPEKTEPAPAPPMALPSLLLDRPIRSGQSVFFEQGDVTIVGSVASGAEVIAGGSVHVYGTLRGRVPSPVSCGPPWRRASSAARWRRSLWRSTGCTGWRRTSEPELRGRPRGAGWCSTDDSVM